MMFIMDCMLRLCQTMLASCSALAGILLSPSPFEAANKSTASPFGGPVGAANPFGGARGERLFTENASLSSDGSIKEDTRPWWRQITFGQIVSPVFS